MTSRQALSTSEGFTQASKVIPVVRSKDAASLIVTQALLPLNTSAFPYFPAVVQVAFAIVPVFPFPDASVTVLPVPSLNEYAATNPETNVPVVALAVFEYGLRLPAASVARTR